MNDPIKPLPSSPLPQDLAGCHALIRQLRDELAQTQRKLSVHEQNEKSRMEHLYGQGVTSEQLLEVGRKFSFDISHLSPQRLREVKEELAAEDAMRARRRSTRRSGKKE